MPAENSGPGGNYALISSHDPGGYNLWDRPPPPPPPRHILHSNINNSPNPRIIFPHKKLPTNTPMLVLTDEPPSYQV